MMYEVDEVLAALETLSNVINTSVESLQDVQVALLQLMESHQRRAAHSTGTTAGNATVPERCASPTCSERRAARPNG
jgi:hypothetical protein